VRVVVIKDESGAEKLGFEFPEGPVTPKPEIPANVKPKRASGSSRRKPPKGDSGPPNPRGSVPKVPLVRV
jgi:ATP-dependent Clp protease ATP-binding subunit ClpA